MRNAYYRYNLSETVLFENRKDLSGNSKDFSENTKYFSENTKYLSQKQNEGP